MPRLPAAHLRLAPALLLGALLAALPAHAADGTSLSPSALLAKTDATLGTQGAAFHTPYQGPQAANPVEDRTAAPYFYVAGGDPKTERLPLKETSADVQIAGVIAKVKVRQVFENDGAKPIEAVYVFPASTRAAVHGMRMKIGARTVEAKIQRKADARAQYEQAKAEGKRASLLEQERPNVFTMSVANVMPKDRLEVELDYSELLVPDESVYEFVYPAVVGPRYGGGADPAKDKFIASPYQPAGEKELYRFDVRVHVETGIALKELSSPSHKITVNRLAPASADVRLSESGGGNKDFVLRYRLAGDKVETGALLWKGEQENFFLVMVEPPQRPTLAQIPPREYIFLLDVSGSMHGFPLDTAKVLAKNLFAQLRPTDQFNVAMFSGGNFVMSPEGSLPATPGNIELATNLITQQRGGGGTELMGGLRAAYGIPKKSPNVSRSVIVVTDGYVGVEAQAFKFIRGNLDQANLFAFGIGSSVNRALIEGMARAGQGEPFVVLGPEKAAAEAERLRQYVQAPVLSSVQVTFPGFDAREVAPMKVPDVMARRPVVLFGKYRGEARGKVEVTGFSGEGRYRWVMEVTPGAVKAENAPLRWLWARKWVEYLDDQRHLTQAKELEDAITDLGLSYTLLTSFTSFVAVDSEVANQAGQAERVHQPLPMPEGVSNQAVGSTSRSGLGGGAGRAMEKSVQQAPRPMLVAPASPSAPPPTSAAPARRRSAKAEEAEQKATGPRWLVADLKAAGLADTRDLLLQIDQRLQSAGACGGAGTVKLRLTLDQAGRVVKVEVLSGDATLGACLRGKLQGLASASKPQGPTGTLELVLRAASF